MHGSRSRTSAYQVQGTSKKKKKKVEEEEKKKMLSTILR
jgi:hypothetical protein